MTTHGAILITLFVPCVAAGAVSIPIPNGDFEAGDVFESPIGYGYGFGEANMPAPWSSPDPFNPQVSGDTWSHLGAPRGMPPTTIGVFWPSTRAFSGDRWLGAWDFEYIAAPLSIALVPGEEYSISAAIIASNLGHGGTFEVAFGNSVSDRSMVAGVFPGVTVPGEDWVYRTLTFTATPAMASASCCSSVRF